MCDYNKHVKLYSMKKGFSLIILFLFLTNLVYAQELESYLLKFDYTKIDPLEIVNRNFHVVELTGNMDTTVSFGKVILWPFKKTANVGFKEGLNTTIKNYLSFQTITNPLTDSSFQCMLEIKKVIFNERVDNDIKIATVSLEINYYNRDHTLIYNTLTKNDVGGMAVTDHLEHILQNCINQSLQLFNFVDKKKIRSMNYDDNDIRITKDTLKKGIYGSFNEFKNNNPAFLYDFKVHNRAGKVYKKSRDTNDLYIDITDPAFNFDRSLFLSAIYGFCDGENVYIKEKVFNNEFGFVEISPKGRYIVFKGSSSGVSPGSIIVGGLVGGFVGVLVGGLAGSGIKEKGEFILDVVTGETYTFDNANLDFIIEQYPDFNKTFVTQPEGKYKIKTYWIELLNQYISNS
jgi:hypothetical protein